MFWRKFQAIYEIQEIQEGFSDRQKDYLEYLLFQAADVQLESTRCHFKVRDLARISGGEAILVHLYRTPSSFATSHLIPSGQQIRILNEKPSKKHLLIHRNEARKILNKAMFWLRKTGYDNWAVETVLGDGNKAPMAHFIEKSGMNPKEVYELSAVGKLMAYWKANYCKIEKDGKEFFGDKYLSVSFEKFCRDPISTFRKLYRVLNSTMPKFDFSAIHEPNPPFQQFNPRWMKIARILELRDFLY